MTVDFAALRDLDLGPLRDRVDAWTTVATRMEAAASVYRAEVHAGMSGDDWTGTAADLAATRSGELNGLIDAGATEAAAVRDILTGAAERFSSAKRDLDAAFEQAGAISELRITDAGTLDLESGAPDDVRSLWMHHLDGLQALIDSAVDDARTADDEVAEALRLVAQTGETSGNAFNGHAGEHIIEDPDHDDGQPPAPDREREP